MSRIDAIIATQIGDAVRPPSAAIDRQLQTQAAQAQKGQDAAAGTKPVTAEQLHSAASQLKQVIEAASSHRLSLDIDPDSNQTFMRVRDSQTGETIKQIPSKEVLELHARLKDFIGLFIDKKA